MQNPFVQLAEIHRGPAVESLHHGIAVVAVNLADGASRAKMGVFAALLGQLGLLDAAATAALVRDWLARMGLSESALVCGPDMPRAAADQAKIYRAGGDPSRIYHNCSGKHCGFLSVSQKLGAPVAGYDDPAHPTQKLYLEILSELLDSDAGRLQAGVDGCGLPALALSMQAMAQAAARWAARKVASPARRSAIERLQAAIAKYPDHLSGAVEGDIADSNGKPVGRIAVTLPA